eukprot:scaffold133015_cov36-Phaeocystis_antarctica.AAC.1
MRAAMEAARSSLSMACGSGLGLLWHLSEEQLGEDAAHLLVSTEELEDAPAEGPVRARGRGRGRVRA